MLFQKGMTGPLKQNIAKELLVFMILKKKLMTRHVKLQKTTMVKFFYITGMEKLEHVKLLDLIQIRRKIRSIRK